MQKVVPNLWFDGNAREAAEFYTNIFPGSKITGGSKYPLTKEEGLADFQLDLAGKDLTVDCNLAGHDFTFINAGPEFVATPANSFFINFDPLDDPEAREHLDQVWEKLKVDSTVLMDLGGYPFSKYYGWIKDKFGFSWQLILTNPEGDKRPCIIPSLLFSGKVQNRAGEAIDFYTHVFKNSRVGQVSHYEAANHPVTTDSVAYGDFEVAPNEWFAVMDSGVEQDTDFNEAVSYSISCKDQDEIDYFWNLLSSVPESEQCGWCKDKFGVSWQIVPESMAELMKKPDAFSKMMEMKKLVIADF